MRSLLLRPAADVDLWEHYAHGWLATGGVRVNFISSVDGGSALAGVSGGLQTSGDNQVFETLRDQADVVLVGSGTTQAEGYQAVHLNGEKQALRTSRMLSATLTTAVVSNKLDLDPESELFDTHDGEPRTIVVTTEGSPDDRRRALQRVADVVVAGSKELDWPAVIDQLTLRGLTRVLCEGGPGLFGRIAAAGVVDELCLTLTPMLAGPGSGRIVAGPEWPTDLAPLPLDLVGLLESDGALFCRYARH